MLQDPNAVHVNMLRGAIAKPTWKQIKHLYAAEVEADEAAIIRLTRDLDDAKAEARNFQEILDSRPAINAGLPESYIRWSQSIYSGDIIRASLGHKP